MVVERRSDRSWSRLRCFGGGQDSHGNSEGGEFYVRDIASLSTMQFLALYVLYEGYIIEMNICK
jgi:hypothetical protein